MTVIAGSVAVVYLRVSTAEQAGSGLGLEAQEGAILRACEHRGVPVDGPFVDAGISGSAKSRPGLDAALAACDAHARARSTYLVIAKLDRIARSLVGYAAIVERARAGHWTLVALDTPESETPQGEAMQGMTAIFAQLERRLIGQRTREALAAARARGIRLGRPISVDPAIEARIVDMRRRQGLGAAGIARALTAEGVPAPAGGATWQRSTVARVLYRGGISLPLGRPKSPPKPKRRRRRRRSAANKGSHGAKRHGNRQQANTDTHHEAGGLRDPKSEQNAQQERDNGE